MENYYPIMIKDSNDGAVDYIVFVNKNTSPEKFNKYVDQAITKLQEEDYDMCYWDAICEKLPDDLDFYTYYSPDTIYY